MAKDNRHTNDPLEPGVAEQLQVYLDDIREVLLDRAAMLTGTGFVSQEGLAAAIREADSPLARFRSIKDVQDVISQALTENRRAEYVSYVMILALFVFGLILLGRGALSADATTRIGSIKRRFNRRIINNCTSSICDQLPQAQYCHSNAWNSFKSSRQSQRSCSTSQGHVFSNCTWRTSTSSAFTKIGAKVQLRYSE